MSERENQNVFLYVLQAKDISFFNTPSDKPGVVFKIGYSNDIKNRFKALQNGCPSALGCTFLGVGNIEYVKDIERYLKNCHLENNRLSGGTEWFYLLPEDFFKLLIDLYITFDSIDGIPEQFRYLGEALKKQPVEQQGFNFNEFHR